MKLSALTLFVILLIHWKQESSAGQDSDFIFSKAQMAILSQVPTIPILVARHHLKLLGIGNKIENERKYRTVLDLFIVMQSSNLKIPS